MGRVGRRRISADEGRHGHNAGEDTQCGVEERNGAVRPARLLDLLVDVFTMRQEDILSPIQAQDQSETDVEEDEDHRRDDDDDRDALDEQPDRESEDGRSDSVAARVAEERLGTTEVEREESYSSTASARASRAISFSPTQEPTKANHPAVTMVHSVT